MPPIVSLSLFWFCYFAGLGIFFPYYGLYLHENAGLTGTQVGIVLAAVPLVGSMSQMVWGQIADRTGARTLVLAVDLRGWIERLPAIEVKRSEQANTVRGR